MSDEENTSRNNILNLIESFIQQVVKIRGILVGVSVSGIILAPIAIGLAVYLISHPIFYDLLDSEDNFGEVLLVFLGAVISISTVWFVTGIRQYRSMSSWQKRYNKYLQEKNKIDKEIESQFGLDDN